MSRSGSPYSAPTDSNRRPVLIAASTTDGITPVALYANPTTHKLLIEDSGIIAALGSIGGTTKYTTLIDDTTTTNVTYIGKAVPTGADIPTNTSVWQLTKIDETTGVTSIKYANGSLAFNNKWTDRVGATYA